ncbi:MAG: protein TolR [Burkholderiales bacterium]|nr:protein TolR [Burkholderiales bacterium]
MLIEKRGGRRLMNQINVVPYIDVMLVLLVIFMVTAPMMSPSQIDLPSVAKASAAKVAPLQIVVNKNGNLSLRDQDGKAERAVKLDELIRLITERQSRNPELAVVIAADKDVYYKNVVDVMDTLQRNNVQKVGLLVRSGN